MELNFIRVEHNGKTISLVQHTLEATSFRDKDRIIQEVTILPEMEKIVSYDGSLESLIKTLQIIKTDIEDQVT